MYLVACVLLSAILVLAAIAAGRNARWPALNIAGISVVLFLLPIVAMTQLNAVGLQGLFLVFAAAAVSWRSRPRNFTRIAIGATLLAYGIVGYFAFLDLRALRTKYPVESLEARLPAPSRSGSIALDRSAAADLDMVEQETRTHDYRASLLQMLHENTLRTFAEQPGFGFSRMSGMAMLAWSSRDRDDEDAIDAPAPDLEALSAGARAELMHEVPDRIGSMREMHNLWVPAFFEPRFGYFVDRRHVVGFSRHGIREEPYGSKTTPKSVQLIGLVVHPEPVAYVSQGLPSMKNLPRTPLRPLDTFETKGLASLKEGHPLFVRQTSSGPRVLGPIRAMKQCVECHDCERGRLLGAFSYTLTPSP